jgi:Flp pilus assembly pilin Flp
MGGVDVGRPSIGDQQMQTLRAGVGGLAAWGGSALSAIRAVRTRLPDQHQETERGQGLAEYALILAFIAIVAIAALAFFGVQLSSVLTDPVGTEFSGVVSIINP